MEEMLIKLCVNRLKELQNVTTLPRRVEFVKWARKFGNELLVATESGDSVCETVEKTVSTLKTGAAALADVLQLSVAGGCEIEKSTSSSPPSAEKPKEPNKANSIPDLTDKTADSESMKPNPSEEERNDLTDLDSGFDAPGPEPLTPGKRFFVGSRHRIRTLSTEEGDRFMMCDDETEDDVLQ